MVIGLAHRCGGKLVLAAAIALLAGAAGAAPSPTAPSSLAQSAPPAAAVPQQPAPDQPGQPATPGGTDNSLANPGDLFGEDVTLTAKPIIYLKGSGTWDQAFATISDALKKVEAYVAQKGLKADGLPMTIFTSTDDHGFDYEAAIPLAEAPRDGVTGAVALGLSPVGHALRFVHRGSYDSLDDTYEAITNYLDDKQLESQDVLIEQYVTDPTRSDPNNLVVNVIVLTK